MQIERELLRERKTFAKRNYSCPLGAGKEPGESAPGPRQDLFYVAAKIIATLE